MLLSPPVSARFSVAPAAFGWLGATSAPLGRFGAVLSGAPAGSAEVLGSLSPCPWCSIVDLSLPASICSLVGAEAVGAGAVPPAALSPPAKVTSEQE